MNPSEDMVDLLRGFCLSSALFCKALSDKYPQVLSDERKQELDAIIEKHEEPL